MGKKILRRAGLVIMAFTFSLLPLAKVAAQEQEEVQLWAEPENEEKTYCEETPAAPNSGDNYESHETYASAVDYMASMVMVVIAIALSAVIWKK